MCSTQNTNFGRDWTKIAWSTTVDTDAVFNDALTHQLFGEAANSFLDLFVATSEWSISRTSQLRHGSVTSSISSSVALRLQSDAHCISQQWRCDCFNSSPYIVTVIKYWCVLQRRNWSTSCDDRSQQLTLQSDRLFDVLLCGIKATSKNNFVNLWRTIGVVVKTLFGSTGFNHHDCNVSVVKFTTGNNQFESSLFTLSISRVRSPCAVLRESNAHCTNRTIEWDSTDHQGSRSGVDA